MKLRELPQTQQDAINSMFDAIANQIAKNDSYRFVAYNKSGIRHFTAERHCISYQNTKTGYYRGFGGGTYWTIQYGEVSWKRYIETNPVGEKEQHVSLCKGKTYASVTANGGGKIEFPKEVATKKEVIEIYKRLVAEGGRDFPKYTKEVTGANWPESMVVS